MLNINTAKLQTHVSFGENFVSTCTKIYKMALAIGAERVPICASTKIHETTARSCRVVLSCFRVKYLSNARKPSAALRGLFCLKFDAPCRFRILIISLLRENWGYKLW